MSQSSICIVQELLKSLDFALIQILLLALVSILAFLSDDFLQKRRDTLPAKGVLLLLVQDLVLVEPRDRSHLKPHYGLLPEVVIGHQLSVLVLPRHHVVHGDSLIEKLSHHLLLFEVGYLRGKGSLVVLVQL